MRKLIDPDSSCGFCGGYALGTRCESCGAGSDNYDAPGGEQGWVMKSKLNELRLDAGISRLHDEPKFMVAVDKEGKVIDPLVGLEKFADLIIRECISAVEDTNDRHRRDYFAAKIKQHFGIQE